MSKSNALETDLLKYLFTDTPIAALSGVTTLYVSLHTADPGEAGTQTTSESAYGGYARAAVARSTSGWTAAAGSCSPVAPVDFPACTSGSETITHFAVGTTSAGAGYLLYCGSIAPTIAISTGVAPRLTTASAITED
jgi:hypothetical protein